MIDHALAALREHEPGTIVGLTYHPDADPGDGSGWCCEVGDLHTYGQRDEAAAKMLARLGVPETEHDDPIVSLTAERDQAIAERDALAAVVRRIAEACDKCQTCEAPAVCIGGTAGDRGVWGGCSECCGHGNESDWCITIADTRALLPSEVPDAG